MVSITKTETNKLKLNFDQSFEKNGEKILVNMYLLEKQGGENNTSHRKGYVFSAGRSETC